MNKRTIMLAVLGLALAGSAFGMNKKIFSSDVSNEELKQYKCGVGYYCPSCDYATAYLKAFKAHVLKKHRSKYDIYKRDHGVYCCPGCERNDGMLNIFKADIIKKRR